MQNDPLRGAGGAERAHRADPAPRPAARPTDELRARGPAFEVLLERLQARARELEETSRTVDDPARLAGAVDRARASLEDALTLGDRLLEAWRATTHQAPPPPVEDASDARAGAAQRASVERASRERPNPNP